jgi:phosphatidylglycerophosphate synthase
MTETRRPIRSRSNATLRKLAGALARTSVTPNQVSVASVLFAAAGALALQARDSGWAMLLALCAIQMRLLCNVLDGLLAVEGGKKTAQGALYNEFPDRLADTLLIVGAGYAAGMPSLGWAAALLAALTAYVRVFGGSSGLEPCFVGPMAKQHRMAVLSAASLLSAGEALGEWPHYSLPAALIIITVGSALTCVTRTRAIARALEQRGQ